MAEISVAMERTLPQLLGEQSLDINFQNLYETINMLGEDPADNTKPPIAIDFRRSNRWINEAGFAWSDTATRHVEVFLATRKIPKINFFRVHPIEMRSEQALNEILVHELCHAVDFANPEIASLQHSYTEERESNLDAIVHGNAFKYIFLADRAHRLQRQLWHESPYEVRAYSKVKQLVDNNMLPRIVTIQPLELAK